MNSPIINKKNSSNEIKLENDVLKPTTKNHSELVKPLLIQTSRKGSSNQITLEEDIEKHKINLNLKKLNSTKEASISTTAEEFMAMPKEKTDSLFDKVLIQVKEKNRGNYHIYFRQKEKK